jgi:hypothetical protein
MNKQEEFHCALEDNDLEKIKNLLKNKNVNPTFNKSYSLGIACYIGNEEVIKLLLDDNRVDPSYHNNYLIQNAFKNQERKVISLLWNDKRVKLTLKSDLPNIYKILLKKDTKKKIKEF